MAALSADGFPHSAHERATESLALRGMTDISSGLFALGGALIGAAGTQVGVIINSVSKGRARKAKITRQDAADRLAKQGPLYEGFTSRLSETTSRLNGAVSAIGGPNYDPVRTLAWLNTNLRDLRDLAVRVQIHGSEQARLIAAAVVSGTDELWGNVTSPLPVVPLKMLPSFTSARDALTPALANMVQVARTDIGSGTP